MGDDTVHTGHEVIAVDESFKPIIDEEAYVFKGIFTEAKPEFKYVTENEALRDLLNDSVRVAILSRELDTTEARVLKNRTLPPETIPFAIDAVVLIVNKASNDTLITVNDIKKMLNGDTKTDRNIVFDNPNSSLVRYLKDFSGNKELQQKNIYALKSNKEVLKYVSTHDNAIGIIGFSWLNDPDPDYAADVNNVKIVAVRDENSKAYGKEYYKPSQTSLVLKQYPLSRRLYVINSTGKVGLGRGFADFVSSDRGQRIILKSGLLPDSIPQRLINIKE
ncbi:PstS family phosphate ABC transporter substrate-binding protein [Mucilaginibacter sp. KACC 22063]|uniref:PstS family phosphate ABC transporter substrate-binding protein n=1 Tax=Mucilaginibacter sp. KACC 22063 TaxID=3025666 RepID=UPI0023652238|nr:substrate-binding domain-containing protein [Mucilaginibacter sp. KACC 22063]WDF55136.1 substrate-binding domain-containing protein [Mucilaginibacter sp. KACC 22063]